MAVQELRQLLAQAFIALALVPAQYRLLEKPVLNVLRQLAPQIERGEAQRLYVALEVLMLAHAAIKGGPGAPVNPLRSQDRKGS